jgi:hypothetical protein
MATRIASVEVNADGYVDLRQRGDEGPAGARDSVSVDLERLVGETARG